MKLTGSFSIIFVVIFISVSAFGDNFTLNETEKHPDWKRSSFHTRSVLSRFRCTSTLVPQMVFYGNLGYSDVKMRVMQENLIGI